MVCSKKKREKLQPTKRKTATKKEKYRNLQREKLQRKKRNTATKKEKNCNFDECFIFEREEAKLSKKPAVGIGSYSKKREKLQLLKREPAAGIESCRKKEKNCNY